MQVHYHYIKYKVILGTSMANVLQTESTLTDRYQTTIPDAVRKALHLNKRDKILYTVQPNGNVVISKINDNNHDPVIDRFLAFLAEDMKHNPQRLKPVNQSLLSRIESLVADVEFDLEEALPEEVEEPEHTQSKSK